jgi:gamma-glutamyltranspeptidase
MRWTCVSTSSRPALIYDAKAKAVRYLDGGGRAAASASAAWFHGRGHTIEIPFRGVLPATLTTPGAVASWVEAHKAYGRLAHWIEATAPQLAPHADANWTSKRHSFVACR